MLKRVLFIVLLAGFILRTIASANADFGEFQTTFFDGAKGILTVSGDSFHLSNSGQTENGQVIAAQPFDGNGEMVARIEYLENSSGKIGLAFRETTNSASRYAGMYLTRSNVVFERVADTNKPATTTLQTNAQVTWLRVVREGPALSGFHSNDGTNWFQISADTVEMKKQIFVALEVMGKGDAVFEHVRMLSGRLSSPSETENLRVPTNLLIQTKIGSFGTRPERVEFFENARRIGESKNPPYSLLWSNALAESRSFTAKITDVSGTAFFTEPVNCEIKLPPNKVSFISSDDSTQGNWKDNYGTEGFQIVNYATNLPFYTDVSFAGQKSITISYPRDVSALQFTNNSGRIVSHWFSYTNMTITVGLLDGHSHQVAFYFYDSDTNVRVQTVEVIDPLRNVVFDTRKLAKFHGGRYLLWNVRGKVQFRISHDAGGPSVTSGIFFDPESRSEKAKMD